MKEKFEINFKMLNELKYIMDMGTFVKLARGLTVNSEEDSKYFNELVVYYEPGILDCTDFWMSLSVDGKKRYFINDIENYYSIILIERYWKFIDWNHIKKLFIEKFGRDFFWNYPIKRS